MISSGGARTAGFVFRDKAGRANGVVLQKAKRAKNRRSREISLSSEVFRGSLKFLWGATGKKLCHIKLTPP